MLNTLIKKMFGSRNERTLRRMEKVVAIINQHEAGLMTLSDESLKAKAQEFRQKISEGIGLDTLLPDVFATVRETSRRVLGLRHFDVQMIGGMVLHEGNIAEMRTGEGKTLVATLPACLNAFTGKGVHVVTVNDYLAKRDSQWMAPVYEFLGLSVGVIHADMTHAQKQEAYACDIVYGTNNEFGFDYLRDNMAFNIEDKVQRELHFAIVDEVDSILIDEARTPLIISGAAESSLDLYTAVNKIIPNLKKQISEEDVGDFTVDEKQKTAHLTEQGHQHIEDLLSKAGLLKSGESLYHASNIILMHHINAALRAHVMFHRDVDYIVQNGQVVIVDEHTGRTMPGRRWSEGLHQAVEAKENVAIQQENQTLASITFQNFFRLYQKLSGMTGTADTEAFEFQQIYNLDVVVIPTNKPMQRIDQPDQVFLTLEDKYNAVIVDVQDCVKRKQPVLVGTASIEASELLSKMMNKAGIKHQVLNAKFHEKEAQIIAEAGRPGAVTIATNMAGRGTDIVLGGNVKADLALLTDASDEAQRKKIMDEWNIRHEEVIAAGGLRIIGSERHESRRIDNQLRGRSGRQGDPGSSRFYLSLDDTLMRIFTSERVANMMRKLGMKPGEPIEHGLVTRAIENAQRKLEGHHFDVRKQLLDYDNVANDQRQVIYHRRASVMASTDLQGYVYETITEVVELLSQQYIPYESLEEQWDAEGLMRALKDDFNMTVPVKQWIDEDHQIQPEEISKRLVELAVAHYREKEQVPGSDVMSQFEKSVILQTIDSQWREHLAAMDHLRQGIHLRGYAQKDPKQEYKREAFYLFKDMLDSMDYDIAKILLSVEISSASDAEAVEEQRRSEQVHHMNMGHDFPDEQNNQESGSTMTVRRNQPKVGRNDPCPCGSQKKYKTCHGKVS